MTKLLNTAIGPFTAKIWLGILAALALTAWAVVEIADNRDQRMIETAEEKGASGAVIAGHETTLDQIGAANEAGNQVRDDRGATRHDECLRNVARGYEASCDRYKPVEPVPGGSTAAAEARAGPGVE